MDAGAARWFQDAAAFDRLSAQLWDPVSSAAVADAAPRAGEFVLDACAGAGAASVLLARAVGPGGRVDAVDLAAPLVALTAERARDLPALRAHHADVLAFGDEGAYDLVVCVLGVFFLPDLHAAGRHLLTRARPGGRLCVGVWAEGALTELVQPLAAAAARARGEGPPEPRSLPHALGTEEGLTAWAAAVGVRDPVVHRHPARLRVTPEAVRDAAAGTAAGALLDGLPAATARAVVDEAAAAALEPREADATTLVVVGTRDG
ncbi:class I SAM-dependent methyltransferase [Kineococcus sp. SYSU DK004]|uniref:class I SAM-dependent methyltransferase n=1 Tax=Kineococcus sp. SYSU DK004 TaxID=3383125 RepID=UPI003D7DD60B